LTLQQVASELLELVAKRNRQMIITSLGILPAAFHFPNIQSTSKEKKNFIMPQTNSLKSAEKL